MTIETKKRAASGVPQWVKLFGWVGIAALVVVVAMIASGHGPWQHMAHMSGS